jgi:hypothetical protein
MSNMFDDYWTSYLAKAMIGCMLAFFVAGMLAGGLILIATYLLIEL